MDDRDMEFDTQSVGSNNKSRMSRAEKSRIAAKTRRDKENVAMQALIEELPVSNEILNKMDKTSIIRLAIFFIRIKHYVQKDMLALTTSGNYNGHFGNKVKPPLSITAGNKTKEEPVFDLPSSCIEEGQLMLEALNGFLIFISKKGKVQFVSKTVEDHLGLKQVHMIGKSITDFIHNADHAELLKQFTRPRAEGKLAITEHEGYGEEDKKVFYLRMKFSLPKPGSKAKNEGYMLVQWSGKIKRHRSSKTGKIMSDGLLCICRPMKTTSILEIRMDGNMFMSRHDLKMTFTFCDTRILTLIGYEPNEVIGKTAYYFHNPLDAPRVSDCHSKLIVKGSSVSKYYRFLGKNSDWVWLQTRATIIYNTSSKPQYIVCMNYVISEEEGERFLMLEEQKQNSITLPDNHDDITVSLYGRQNTACQGPKIVEIPSDDDDNDSDIGKSLPRLRQTVSKTQERQSQKRICIRIPPLPPESQSPTRQSTDFIPACQGQTDQLSLCCLNQPVVNQQALNEPSLNLMTLTETTLSQPTLSQTTLCQTAPVVSDAAFSMVSQGQEYLPADVKPTILELDNANVAEQVNTGFLEDLTPGQVPAVSMAAQAFSSLAGASNSHEISSGSSSPPYTLKLYRSGPSDENGQNAVYDASQGNLSDGGYESATSPYSSTNTASPLQNVEFLQDVESSQSIIQGDNSFLGIGYSCSPPVSMGNPEVSQSNIVSSRGNLTTDGMDMLDELLKSINQETGSGNTDFPLSTVSSIANTNTGPLMSTTEPMSVYSPSPERPDSRSNDRPFLRSLLNMPENDIPKTPIMMTEFSFHTNSPAESGKSGFSPQSDTYDSDSQHSGYLQISSGKNVNNMKQTPNSDDSLPGYQKMELSDVPQDINDLAINFLDDMSDDHDLSDLGSDILMDTGDDSDFSKHASSILTRTVAEQSQYATGDKHGTIDKSIKTQSKSSFPTVVNQSAPGKQTGNRFSVPVAPKKLGAQSVVKPAQQSSGNNSSFTSLHVDHGYHQTKGTKNQLSKMRSPHVAGPSSRVNGQMSLNNSRPPYQTQRTCRGQSRETSCMSQLERQLRGCSSVRNGRPTCLEQLLTGELTEDRYIAMERERCRYMNGVNHS